MTIKQISVFLENHTGQLAEITDILAGEGINLRAIHVAETADYGVLRIIVNHPEEAAETLKSHGMIVTLTDVIGVGIDDRPGAFSKAVRSLSSAGVNIEYMYAFIGRNENSAYVIIRPNDSDKAIAALTGGGYSLLSPEDLKSM